MFRVASFGFRVSGFEFGLLKIFTANCAVPTLQPVSSPNYTLHRATVDDLVGLKQLWERAHLQVLDLEKRLTEFQLIATETGDLLGAVGLHIEGKHGKIHSEAFAQTDDQDALRQLIWERVQSVSRNHGLVRLWTEEGAPFWSQRGFIAADADMLKKIPPGFGGAVRHWLTLQLKEETVPTLSLDQEFELFQQSQRQSTEQVMAQARKLRSAAYVIGTLALTGALIGGFFLFKQVAEQKRRQPGPPATSTNQVRQQP